jgi:hypothetical protein
MQQDHVIAHLPERTWKAVRKKISCLLRRLCIAFSVPAFLFSTCSQATPQQVNADQVQAAYLYNFGKFVKWPDAAPANQSGTFTICVLDGDPFGDALRSTLAGESVGGKPVAVKRLPNAEDAAACHILFISSAQEKDLSKILTAVDQASVLTVSDISDFSRRGGMIQFILQGNRLRFEINLESAQKSHLVFASELLKVAAAVTKPARSGD